MSQLRAILFAFVSLGAASAWAYGVDELLPRPASVRLGQGKVITSARLCVQYQGVSDPRIEDAFADFRDRLLKGVNLEGLLWNKERNDYPHAVTLVVETLHAGLAVQALGEDESYGLDVEEDGIRLKADNALGVLHGLQTLLQLAHGESGLLMLPAVSIQDSPRFPWRGLLIDSSRHWMSVDTMRLIIEGMAVAKLNVLHWHLSDDQGFRVESKLYPKLQELASDGKFYKQDEVRKVLDYARAHGIRVVPEFDMPGHCSALLAAYPELGSRPGPYAIEDKFGIFDPTLDPSREETYQFIDGFLGEMAGLFPDAYLHIGGDENNGKEWDANPKIQAFKAEHGYKSNEELQAYFSGRMAEILSKHGKRTVGWDEIQQGKIPKGTMIQAWRGTDQLRKAANAGFDTLLSAGYYLDLGLTAGEHYLQDPLPSKPRLSAKAAAHVLGGEACMWSELVDEEGIHARLWPRTLAVAERLWSPAKYRDVDEFCHRMDTLSKRLNILPPQHFIYPTILLGSLAVEGNPGALNGKIGRGAFAGFMGERKIDPETSLVLDVGREDHGALQVLADALSPVRYYQRHDSRPYTRFMPLNRWVDAVVPDGPGPRLFADRVHAAFCAAPDWSETVPVERQLRRWSQNHALLVPIMKRSERAAEALPLSEDLKDLGDLGLEALQFIRQGKNADKAWQQKAAQRLEAAAKPKAELELTVLPSVRKMVFGAARIESLKGLSGFEWDQKLEAQVQKATPREEP